MRGDLVRLELALVHQGLDVGVVLGQLGQLPAAQAVAARVTHVAHAKLAAVKRQRGQGRAHALGVGVGLNMLGDGPVTVLRRRTQQREHVVIAQRLIEVLQVLHHELGGDLAGSVATHAIGKHEQVRARVRGVLVVGAHQAAIGGGGVVQG